VTPTISVSRTPSITPTSSPCVCVCGTTITNTAGYTINGSWTDCYNVVHGFSLAASQAYALPCSGPEGSNIYVKYGSVTADGPFTVSYGSCTPAPTQTPTPSVTPSSTPTPEYYYNVYSVDGSCNTSFSHYGRSTTSYSNGYYIFDAILYYFEGTTFQESASSVEGATASSCTPPPSPSPSPASGYDFYYADDYYCAEPCGLTAYNQIVAFPAGSSPTINKYYWWSGGTDTYLITGAAYDPGFPVPLLLDTNGPWDNCTQGCLNGGG
jgi:hypothetical protein